MERASRAGSSAGAKPSSKELSLPGGKENAPPSERRIPMRRKLSFSSDVRQAQGKPPGKASGKALAKARVPSSKGEAGHALLVKTLTAKRTPFHIHCDERNSAVSRRRAGTPLLRSADEKVLARSNDRAQVESRRSGDGPRVASRKRLASGSRWPANEPRNDGKPRPSGIPRPLGSAALSSEVGWGSLVACGTTVGAQPGRLVSSASTSVATRKARTTAEPARSSSPRARDSDGAKRCSTVPVNAVQEATAAGPRSTRAVDGASPPNRAFYPKEAMGRSKSKAGMPGKPGQTDRVEGTSGPKERDDYCPDLLYHTEYNDDLVNVEREREERSPRLSDDFLSKNINAEQRKLMVAFMIHLGIHCRYPSFVVYRSVKLFDAAMDRIRVDTAFIQLSALACLWIALKNLELSYKIPTATKMVGLAGDLYVGKESLLTTYETRILQALNFNVTFADVFALYAHQLINCRCYIHLSDETAAFVYNCGCYVIDITLLDEEFCHTSANLIAVSAIELALGVVLDTEKTTLPVTPRWMFWRGLLFAAIPRVACRVRDQEIDKVRIAMLRRVVSSGKKRCGFDIVYSKYSRSRNGRISESFLERVNRLRPTETLYDA